MNRIIIVAVVLAAALATGCEDDSSGPDPTSGADYGNYGYGGYGYGGLGGSGEYDLGFDPAAPGPEPMAEDPTATPTCGRHSHSEGTNCLCNDGYEWCSSDPDDYDCCPVVGNDKPPPPQNVQGLAVLGMRIRPYKYQDADGQPVPWDWDGNVPDWILDAVGILAAIFPELRTWQEVLEKIDEYAPILLDGTTPPDPYIKFTDSLDSDARYYSISSYNSDTVEPGWNDALIDVERFRDAGFVVVEVWDKDVLVDDFIGQIQIPVELVRELSPEGEWRQIDGAETLYEVALASY